MYKQHVGFQSPESLDAPIWRYVDLARFMAMINSSTLWFARLDKLQDQYEGAMPNGRFDVLMAAFDTLAGGDPAYQAKVDVARARMQPEYARLTRESVFVNSWHLGDYESGTMWKNYGAAIAIRSTFARLRDSFEVEPNFDVWIGKTTYVDFDSADESLARHVGPGVHKRQIYDSEKEIRGVIHRRQDALEPKPFGLGVRVDLDRLVESVWVGPGQPNWFAHLIKDLLEKFGIPDKPVSPSEMDGRPLYSDPTNRLGFGSMKRSLRATIGLTGVGAVARQKPTLPAHNLRRPQMTGSTFESESRTTALRPA